MHNLTIAEDIISEVMEREKRRNNLIIFNLPEMERATRIEQTAADTASVQDIFTYVGVSTEVSNPVRLGKYDPTSIQRKRPLKITLPSAAVINEVLRGNKKIKQMERFKSVVINKDKTPNQLRFFKSVKEQLSARLSSGETALTISVSIFLSFLKTMPRKGVKHKQWDPKQMKLTVEAVKNKEMGYLEASKVFGIPKSTIEGYVKKMHQ
ncbi:CENP-B N-terminal DNA-binding domain [Popillia japonica]|uniref:CENP-B N-terminal DNA-binding domain n=1 Tax=Popillia japonica TaxID=7064 RepID=A0AAW1I9Q7_POPJA